MHRIFKIRVKQRRHAKIMQVLLNLTLFLGKPIWKHPSNPTGINAMITRSGMGFIISSTYQTLKTKKRKGIVILNQFRFPLDYLWLDTGDPEEQWVLNDSTGSNWGFDSMSLKLSYDFIMMNLNLELKKNI